MGIRVGIDIGGTFTDLVARDDITGRVWHGKTLTTPRALTEGVVDCIEQVGLDLAHATMVIHGTTVGINALIERNGAATALITTAGFRDVLEIGRGNYRLYDILYQRPATLIPRHLRLEVPERLSACGRTLTPLDEPALVAAAATLREAGIQSVAVMFLFSYVNPAHESRAVEILRRELPGVSVTASHSISREWREYERTSTTVVNAYIQPIMEKYLGAFDEALRGRGFEGTLLVTESNGGMFSVQSALSKPVHTLESGPAAGAVGCAALARTLGREGLISFDMGGTTAKCCIVEAGVPRVGNRYFVDGLPIGIPVVDITEVSAGGGSIAHIDAGKALALGPQSAGAAPGPACYGLGGEQPTVTDANLLVGRISAEAFLGGRMQLRLDLAQRAMRGVAEPLGISLPEAAIGVIRLAEVKMALAVRSITLERGLDPREYALVAYGGCAPLHAVAIARELAIPTVIIPPSPATFSAWGMLAADLQHDLVRTVFCPLAGFDRGQAGRSYNEMTESLLREFHAAATPLIRKAADLRYEGQAHTLTQSVDLDAWDALPERFHAAHERAYGYAARESAIEVINLRLTAVLSMERPIPGTLPAAGATPPVPIGERRIYSSQTRAARPTLVFARERLGAGARLHGPAAIQESTTTTFIDAWDTAVVDPGGFLNITVARESS